MNKLAKVKDLVLDIIFPKFCLGCKQEGEWVCKDCQKQILPVATQVCPDCGRISKFGKYCLRHKKPHGLAGVVVSCYYEEGPIKELIHNFKYNHILELKKALASYMINAFKSNLMASKKDIILTAVPMHFWRKAQRGYNQSEILAFEIAEELKLPKNFKIIKKIHKTLPQVKLSGSRRIKNLQKSFKILNKNVVRSKTIVLVDDVTTTGTTLNECAKVLRQAGARRVWGLVIAKG